MKNTLHTLNKNLRIVAMLVVLTSVLGLKGWGQIAGLELGTASQTGNTTGAATFTLKDANITTLPALTLTAAQQGQAGGNGYISSKTWNYASLNTSAYWQFTVTAASGYQIAVTSLALRMYRSSTGPASIALASDADSYAAIIGGVQTLPSAAYTTISFTGITLSGKSAITFRIYAYGASAATGTLRLGDATASSIDIDLQGSVTTTGSTPPTLTAASGATVDAPFDITFTDDATWRGLITGIKIGATTLTTGYDASYAGKITFTPSASVPANLLQTPNTSTYTIIATGYSDATVSQTIGVGADKKLVMKTQPTAPISNGSPLGTQPEVYIQDQYGNATASAATVTAAVGAGTWTMGGTTGVAAVAGTTTYSGLTATSAAAVTGATISFTSTGLDGITSNTFDIPAPAPQIDWCNLQFPSTATITLGAGVDVYAQVYEAGLTEPAGQGAGITAWIGYGTSNTDLSGYTWIPATYNTSVGNNDEYKANIGSAITSAGTYYYASRFQLGVAPYVYGGTSGIWVSGQSGTLIVNHPGPITWCNVQYPASGAINTGGAFDVYARVYQGGVTNVGNPGAGISAWIGYSTTNTDPSTWSNWVPATFNAAFGDEDEFKAIIGPAIAVPGTYYYASRFKFVSDPYVYGGYNGGIWNGTTNLSGVLTITTPEPTNHATAFTASTTAPTFSTITLNWTDASPAAASYLIKGSSVDYASITAPVDGTAEADGALVKNIAAGIQTCTFTGLTPSTTYYFKIFPYNGTGTGVNYKTDGIVPEASETTLAIIPIKWDGGAATTAWADALNWSGDVVPSATDNVLLDNSLVLGTYSVVLPSGAVKTTINKLAITPTLPNIITLTLPITNTYGAANDAGFVVGDNTASTDDIIINEGGVLVNASGGSTGNGIQVNALASGTCRINNGGKYIHNTSRSGAGIIPSLSSVAGTENGTFEYDVPGTSSYGISASGRTFGSLTLTRTAGAATYTSSGSSALTIKGNLTINSGVTYTTTMTGALNLGGNVTNHGTPLTIAATQAVNFNGTSMQTISGEYNVTLAGAVTINSGSVVSIAPNMGVTVNGTLTNSAGATGLVIKSDATGTGSLIHNTASVPATVKRYMTAGTWHLMSAPVAGQSIPGYVTSLTDTLAFTDPKYGLAPYNTAVPKWDHYTTTNVGDAGNFGVAKGYEILLNLPAATSFAGTLANGIQYFDIIESPLPGNAWNLIGNPFSSAIKGADASFSNDFLNPNKLQFAPGYEALYVWNGTSYTIYNYTSGVNYIAVGQGFFVKSKPDGGTVEFNPAMRNHNNVAYYKNAASPWPSINLQAKIADKDRKTEVFFIPGSTMGIDAGYDAGMFDGGGSANTVYTRLEGSDINFAIQSLPDNAYDNTVVPVGINAAAGTTVSFSAEAVNIPSGIKVYLHDVVTNLYTRLDEPGSLYSAVLASQSSGIGRFYLLTSKQTMGTTENSDDLYSVITVPSENKIRITGSFAKGTQAAIYSLDGKVLYSGKLDNISENEIRFAPAVSGIYLLRIQSGTSVVNRKISWTY